MGWFHLGDSSHAHLLSRAIELDRAAALRVLADELAYTLRGSWYSAGTSRHLIDRIAGWGDASLPNSLPNCTESGDSGSEILNAQPLLTDSSDKGYIRFSSLLAGVAKLAYAADSKSAGT